MLPLRGCAEEDEHADERRGKAERQGPSDIAPAHPDPADHREEDTGDDQDEATGKEREQAITDGGSSHNETDEPSGHLARTAFRLIQPSRCITRWRRDSCVWDLLSGRVVRPHAPRLGDAIEVAEDGAACHALPLLGKVVAGAEAEDFAAIFELLADPTRARLLHALSLSEELCVCDLALLLAPSESALSHQLRLLRRRSRLRHHRADR